MKEYLENLFSLKNKTAIVTGASRGIGSEIAQAYVNAGANVICISRSDSPEKDQLKLHYQKCDISDTRQFQSICKQINSKFGGIDILVNAAGISLSKKINKSEFERFDETLSVNLIATYQCTESAAKFMLNGGSIINITSIGALLSFPSNPGYIASKGGVQALTKAMASDLSGQGIRVNDIAPGYLKTDMTKESYEDPIANKERIDRMIIKRWGSTKDLIGAAIFLASDASSYMTGASIIIDGGWTAKGL